MTDPNVVRRLIPRQLDATPFALATLKKHPSPDIGRSTPEVNDLGLSVPRPDDHVASEQQTPDEHFRKQDLSQTNYITIEGRRLLNFASNNYLGLANDPRVIQAAIEATRTWGTSSGSSPLLSGHTQLHQELADNLSAWKSGAVIGSRDLQINPAHLDIGTILFASGYSANLAAMNAIFEHDAQVFCDRKNHASLIDGLRLAGQNLDALTVRHYRHQDFDQLATLLASSSQSRPRWIVTDSVFSMDGTMTSPDDLLEIAQRFQAGVIADEAHATGVLGPTGSGLFSFASDKACFPKLVVVGTLSKALAASGGFITADKATINSLVQSARPLIYSTGLPPASVAAAWKAAGIACGDPHLRSCLSNHIQRLHDGLFAQGWQVMGSSKAPLLSVIVGTVETSQTIAKQLHDLGIYAPPIRPPTVKPHQCRIRISPTASMSESQIDVILNAFDQLSRPVI